MRNSCIIADNVVVEFPIYNASHRSLKKSLLKATTGGRVASDAGNRVVVRSLDDVSFRISAGDRVALVGHNGSGKTTLLRVLAGVYPPVSGRLSVQGKIVSLIDISLGMDSEATGYENIFLRGVMLGMKPAEISRNVQAIADFSELGEDYLNMPIRTYSSGMQLRLAFAVATTVPADVILMDEWLSVGDASFNEKARERLNHMVNNASVLVLATHSPTLVQSVCNRAFYMEHGRLVRDEIVTSPEAE